MGFRPIKNYPNTFAGSSHLTFVLFSKYFKVWIMKEWFVTNHFEWINIKNEIRSVEMKWNETLKRLANVENSNWKRVKESLSQFICRKYTVNVLIERSIPKIAELNSHSIVTEFYKLSQSKNKIMITSIVKEKIIQTERMVAVTLIARNVQRFSQKKMDEKMRRMSKKGRKSMRGAKGLRNKWKEVRQSSFESSYLRVTTFCEEVRLLVGICVLCTEETHLFHKSETCPLCIPSLQKRDSVRKKWYKTVKSIKPYNFHGRHAETLENCFV